MDMSERRRAIGQRIKQRREKMGMSQDDFAKVSGLCTSFISMTERGIRTPRWDSLAKLASALGTSLAWILEGDHDDYLSGLRMFVEARGLTLRDVDRLEQMARLMFPAREG